MLGKTSWSTKGAPLYTHTHPCTQLQVYHSTSLTVNPTPMKMHIIPIVI